MNRDRLDSVITRIEQMEAVFDRLQHIVNSGQAFGLENSDDKALYQKLLDYYEKGQWLHDYALDEKGALPSGLKRGVLSQDAVYHLLEQIDQLQEEHNYLDF